MHDDYLALTYEQTEQRLQSGGNRLPSDYILSRQAAFLANKLWDLPHEICNATKITSRMLLWRLLRLSFCYLIGPSEGEIKMKLIQCAVSIFTPEGYDGVNVFIDQFCSKQ